MYYVDGKLRHAHDPLVQNLTDAVHRMFHASSSAAASVGEALRQQQPGVSFSPSLQALAVASFGNTAGCTDLDQLSLPVLRHFEEHWENNEEAGDYRLLVLNAAGGGSGSGMQQLVDALVQDLLQPGGPAAESSNDCSINMELQCQWRVQSIRQHTTDKSKEANKQHEGSIEITSSSSSRRHRRHPWDRHRAYCTRTVWW